MSDSKTYPQSFIEEAEALILENVEDENFGVSELAEAMYMSRSNLLRKVKKSTSVSASQFIRQVRLKKAMEILGQTSLTVSEVSYNVGFASTSYFTKCFREYYGYPPGEVGKVGKSDSIKGKAPNRQRQLAAIMFTDIAGYTSIMQEDEKKAIEYRERHREVFDSTTKKYKGRILQYYGDGTLSTFPSAIDAVQCALEMQLAFTQNEPKLPIRIGIHSGDIIITNEEIIGDGVNVAARIESLAEIGMVYISDKVYDEIKNQTEFFTASIGKHNFKNVTRPIEVFVVSNQALGTLESVESKKNPQKPEGIPAWKLAIGGLVVILACFAIYYMGSNKPISAELEKSIAVLPFKNESSDSTNVYFVNGLMESTLSNLQKINDLKVISRTTSEKYRRSQLSIPEIAEELEVSYLVEGSGQKIGDQVMLNIQLIEASTDRPIWSEQYKREVTDIFNLQNEVAKEITIAIKAMVTPQELQNIQKQPTENLEAYDYYLQALDPFYSRTPDGLQKAIGLFKKAIEKDNEFALAYANIAISYYFLDMFQNQKQYTEKINSYSDQALLYDPLSDVSLTAKSLYYIENKEYHLALPNLEKALEYNSNSSLAYRMLANFYAFYEPNTEKYLHYSLMDSQLDLKGKDSSSASYGYLGLSNSLVQAGFFDLALKYVNLSLHFDPDNYYAPHLKIFVQFAKDQNYIRTKQLLTKLWNKDTTRIDILNDLAKMHYSQENYDSAYYFYDKLVRVRETQNLNRYIEENIKIAKVYQKMGREEKAADLFAAYTTNVAKDQSAYKSVGKAFQYAYLGEVEKCITHLKEFTEKRNIQFWFLLMENDPLFKPIKKHPEFESVMQSIKDGFWEDHKKLRYKLEEKGLL